MFEHLFERILKVKSLLVGAHLVHAPCGRNKVDNIYNNII